MDSTLAVQQVGFLVLKLCHENSDAVTSNLKKHPDFAGKYRWLVKNDPGATKVRHFFMKILRMSTSKWLKVWALCYGEVCNLQLGMGEYWYQPYFQVSVLGNKAVNTGHRYSRKSIWCQVIARGWRSPCDTTIKHHVCHVLFRQTWLLRHENLASLRILWSWHRWPVCRCIYISKVLVILVLGIGDTKVSACIWSKSGIKHPYLLLTLFQACGPKGSYDMQVCACWIGPQLLNILVIRSLLKIPLINWIKEVWVGEKAGPLHLTLWTTQTSLKMKTCPGKGGHLTLHRRKCHHCCYFPSTLASFRSFSRTFARPPPQGVGDKRRVPHQQ